MARTRRRFIGMVASGTVLGFAGCTGSGGGGGGQQETEEQTTTTTTTTTTESGSSKTIAMVDSSFDPIRASVAPGTTVTWVNKDGYGHTVKSAQFHDTAAAWSFESKMLDQGEEASYTFESAGVYEYYCTVHGKGTMCGVVLVGDVSLSKSLPCESSSGGGGGGGGGGGDGGGDDDYYSVTRR